MSSSSPFRAIVERFSISRPHFRRSSSSSFGSARSYNTTTSSAASAVNEAISRVPSVADLQEERRNFSNELGVLEPRPMVYWESLDGQMETQPLR